MKQKIYRILLFFCIAIMAAFTLVPPAHQIPDNHRFVPEVVYQKPPVATLTLTTADLEVAKAQEVCVAVTANGFEQILTMQYSMNWDPKVLQFNNFKNFGLPGMDERNFGRHLLDEGIITFSWYDQQLAGISKEDGTVIYEMCFDAIGDPDSSTSIEFTSKPTVVEISNAASVFLDLRTDSGTISIK
ncbi:MAG: cohesin domain-containing protein [Bacteroidota bacterium]